MAACRRSRTRVTRRPGSEDGVDFDGDALARVVIHDVQRAEVPTIGQCVGRKVHGPAQVGNPTASAMAGASPWPDPLATARRAARLGAQAVSELAVHMPAVGDAARACTRRIPIPSLAGGDVIDPCARQASIWPPTSVPMQRPGDANQPACARGTEVPLGHQDRDRFALRLRAHHFRPRRIP